MMKGFIAFFVILSSCAPMAAKDNAALQGNGGGSAVADDSIDIGKPMKEAIDLADRATKAQVTTKGESATAVANVKLARERMIPPPDGAFVGDECGKAFGQRLCWARGGFTSFEPLVPGDPVPGECRQIYRDFYDAKRLWREFESGSIELEALTAVLPDGPMSPANAAALANVLAKMNGLVTQIDQTFPQKYGIPDRILVYKWYLSAAVPKYEVAPGHPRIPHFNFIDMAHLLKLSIPGFSWNSAMNIPIEDVRGVEGGLRWDGLTVSLRKRASPIEACLDGWRVMARARLTLTNDPLPKSSSEKKDIQVLLIGSPLLLDMLIDKACNKKECNEIVTSVTSSLATRRMAPSP